MSRVSGFPFCRAPSNCLDEEFVEGGAVVQAGEGVGRGLFFEGMVLFLELRGMHLGLERQFDQGFIGLLQNGFKIRRGADIDFKERGDFLGLGGNLLEDLVAGRTRPSCIARRKAREPAGSKRRRIPRQRHRRIGRRVAPNRPNLRRPGIGTTWTTVTGADRSDEQGRQFPLFGEQGADVGVGHAELGCFGFNHRQMRRAVLADVAVLLTKNLRQDEHADVLQQRGQECFFLLHDVELGGKGSRGGRGINAATPILQVLESLGFCAC